MIKVLLPFEGHFKVSSPYGWRADPITGEKKFHNGVDFAVPEGTPIRAVCDGTVFRAGWQVNPDKHDDYRTIGFGFRIWQRAVIDSVLCDIFYGHLSKISVIPDDRIRAGEFICESGNTGKTSGPHLHFGLRDVYTREWLDPEFADDDKIKDVRDNSRLIWEPDGSGLNVPWKT